MSQPLVPSLPMTDLKPLAVNPEPLIQRFPSRPTAAHQDDDTWLASTPRSYTTAQALAEFDAWSRSYDRSLLQYLLFEPTHRVLLSHISASDRRVLDVGCGTGKFLVQVAEKFPETEVVGFDLCCGMLERAKPRCQPYKDRVHLVRGDSSRLPFADCQFDVVTCSHSFYHYPDQQRVVSELYRVLRPGGKLMLVDGDRDGWWGWFIYDVCVTWIEGGVRHCSAERLRQLCHNAGFRMFQQSRHGRLAPFLLTIARAVKPACFSNQTVVRAAG